MKGFWTLWIVLCLVQQSFCQNAEQLKIDSLELVLKTQKNSIEKCNTLNEISRNCYMLNPDLGIKYGNQALDLSIQLNYQKGIASAYLYLGRNISMKGEYSKSLAFYNKSQDLFEELGNQDCIIGLIHLNRGSVYGNQSKFPDALDEFFSALKKFESCEAEERSFRSANAYQNIGNIYNFTENYDKALENYNRAIELFQKIPSEKNAVATNIALKGIVYDKLKNYNQAITMFEEAEKILAPLHETTLLAFVKNWKGSAYLGLNEFEQSIKISSEILKTVQELGDQELLATTYQNIGVAYLKRAEITKSTDEFQMAFENISQSLSIHKKTNNHEGLIKDYRYLSEYYAELNDYKKSLEAHKLFSIYNDSVFNFKNKQSLQNLEDQRTIELRDKEIELNKLTLESKERQKWFYIIGIGLMATIGIMLFYQNRQRKKNNDKLLKLNSELDAANKTKIRFLGILNHDLRSPVSKLIHFLHLQKENPELLDEETKLRMERKTISSAENLLESIEDLLLWSKGQMENFEPNLKQVSINSIFEDLEKYFYGSDIEIVFENPQHLEIFTDENYLKTIMRNLTQNALKATELIDSAKIKWEARRENKNIFLSISDNGKGGSEENFKALFDQKTSVGIQSGLGLHLVRDLAKAIQCKIKIDTKQNEGTIITLIL